MKKLLSFIIGKTPFGIVNFIADYWKPICLVLLAGIIYFAGWYKAHEACKVQDMKEEIAAGDKARKTAEEANDISADTEKKLSEGQTAKDELNKEVESNNEKNRNILSNPVPDDTILLINKGIEAGNSSRKSNR